jgi:hypothetical protein
VIPLKILKILMIIYYYMAPMKSLSAKLEILADLIVFAQRE